MKLSDLFIVFLYNNGGYMKRKITFLLITSLSFSLFASPFNSKLTEAELSELNTGNVLIKNINNKKNMCLDENFNQTAAELKAEITALNPKYLAEVIQIKPYEGNEDLPEKLTEILNNVPDYAGIPLWSERHQVYYDLYSEAIIKETYIEDDKTIIKADLLMEPFGTVDELIEISTNDTSILYTATNQNKLRYYDEFDCVGVKKMKMCVLLLQEGDYWYLYGIGGVNAPKIPFFSERIETSFIGRIKTFCSFIFEKL